MWPHTGEVFSGRDAYIAINRAFPTDSWHIELQRVVAQDDLVVAEVRVPSDEGLSLCVGLYELHDGAVARATEYWVDPDPDAVPAWRQNLRPDA